MNKILKKLDRIEEYIILVSLPLMLLFIFLATVFRYFQLGSITWAEEASRYLMIWLVFAGTSYGVKTKAHLGISFFVNKFNGAYLKALYFIRAFFIILFGVIMVYFSIILIENQIQTTQVSPSLGLPMWFVYSASVFGFTMLIIRTIIVIIQDVKNQAYKEQNIEEESQL